ncbi:gamma carbonic anhydrase family protein [Xanthobacter sediminis]
MSPSPFVLPYHGILPVYPDLLRAGPRAALVGRVTLGPRATLGTLALIRGDGHVVEIGSDFHLGDWGTVHIAHEMYPAIVGDRVTVGPDAVVHACTVGDDCVIEEDAIILDGSVLEAGVVMEAGAIAFPRSRLEADTLYAGAPARPVRRIEAAEREARAARIRALPGAPPPAGSMARLDIHPTTFIAGNSSVSGTFRAGAHASVLFSCTLDARDAEITLGENSNIQDNSVVRCTEGPVAIAADTVVGHNVVLESCSVGTGSLVGTGSRVAAGTVVEPGVLLAAGARTQKGQVLESGFLWGGVPARRIAPLDEKKRQMIPWIIASYREYTADFLASQQQAARQAGLG